MFVQMTQLFPIKGASFTNPTFYGIGMGKSFRGVDSLKRSLGALLRNKKVRFSRDLVLNRMRDKLIFHFYQKVPKESLKNCEPDDRQRVRDI